MLIKILGATLMKVALFLYRKYVDFSVFLVLKLCCFYVIIYVGGSSPTYIFFSLLRRFYYERVFRKVY